MGKKRTASRHIRHISRVKEISSLPQAYIKNLKKNTSIPQAHIKFKENYSNPQAHAQAEQSHTQPRNYKEQKRCPWGDEHFLIGHAHTCSTTKSTRRKCAHLRQRVAHNIVNSLEVLRCSIRVFASLVKVVPFIFEGL